MAFVYYTHGDKKGYINTDQITKIKLLADGAKVYLAGAIEHDTVNVDQATVERIELEVGALEG